MQRTLKDIADLLGATVAGNEKAVIRDIRPIEEARDGDLTFVADHKHARYPATTKATAILVSPKTQASGKNLILCDDPYAAFGKILAVFYPVDHGTAGIHPDAFIEDGALVSPEAVVHPRCFIGRGARIDPGTVLYPGVFIGRGASVGENSVLYPNVCVYASCVIGKRVILHAGVVIGADGFGFAAPGISNVKTPQVGIVQIDDDVEIGANSTVDRATMGKTWIQRNVKIDNLVQVAHNVVIGENTAIAAQVGISGSTTIGRSVLIGGQAGIVGHIAIGDNARIGAGASIHKDIPAGMVGGGTPFLPYRDWMKVELTKTKLPEMRAQIQDLMKKMERLSQSGPNTGEDKP